MVYSRIRKITFLYVSTDSERKRGTTNYRMNRQKKKKKACSSSSIVGKGPKGGLRLMKLEDCFEAL